MVIIWLPIVLNTRLKFTRLVPGVVNMVWSDGAQTAVARQVPMEVSGIKSGGDHDGTDFRFLRLSSIRPLFPLPQKFLKIPGLPGIFISKWFLET